MAAPTVGAVWLNVLPSMRQFPSTLTKQATSAARAAGAGAGQAMGEELAEQTGATANRRMRVQSQRMAATFAKNTTVMTRSLSNFRAGFASAEAAASAFTGRMGSLGGATRRAVDPGINAVGRFAGGFRDAQVAASVFSGRLGTLGGAAGRALAPALGAVGRFRDGFTNSAAAASVFSGRLGSLGGVARTALQPGITQIGNFASGFRASAAAASAFSGRLGTIGGLTRTALQPGITAVRAIGTGMGATGAAAQNAFSRVRQGASAAFGRMQTAATGGFSRVRTGFTSMVANARESQGGVGALGGALSSMGAAGAAAIASVGLGALGVSAVRTAANIQQTTASMAGLYGETAAAEDMMRRMRDYARNTPLETQSLYEAGQNLAYLGLQGDQAMGVIRNVGTALMASGNTSQAAMGNVTGALLSMQSAGQLYAADIQRVSNEMVPAWDLLSAHMGMSIKEVRKEVTEGNLTVDDFVAALQAGDGDYFAMMRKSAGETSKTFSAQFAQVKDNVNIAIAESLLPLLDRAAPALGRFGDRVDAGLRALPGILGGIGARLRESGIVSGFKTLASGAKDFAAQALPGLRAFGSVVAGAFGGVLQIMRPVGLLLQSMAGWMRENQGAVKFLGAALGGAVVAMIAIRTATMLWAGAQAILNAALAANPIGLIVIAIAALVAGVIYAYNNFAWFRNAVNAVGAAVKTAALWIWENGLKPAFNGIMVAARAVGTAALWLWNSAIKPAFNFIVTAAKVLFIAVAVVVLGPIILVVKAVGAIALWLWRKAIQPAFRGISVVALWLWNNVLKPTWNLIKAGLRVLGSVFRWLYTNVVKPVFRWIRTAIRVWWAGAKLIFAQVRKYILGPLGSVFRWLWNRVIKPVWNGISRTIRTVWNNGIKPAFNKVKEGVRLMRKAFNDGRDAIAKAWRGIRNAAKKPVNFLIRTVYNAGILPLWNKIAGIVDGPKLKKAKGFATGGVLPGYTPGRDVHQYYSPSGGRLNLSGGEAIMRPEFTRAVGSDYVTSMNRVARTQGVSGVREEMGMSFASGGVFPGAPSIPSARNLLDAVKTVLSPEGLFSLGGDLITGDYKGAIDKVLKPARRITSRIGTEGLPGVPYQVVRVGGKKIKSKLTDLIQAWNSSFGGGGADAWVGLASASQRLRRAAKWARTQHGKPYQWGGGGNPSWDCSGFIGGIENVIRGLRPGRRYTTHSFGGSPPPGWVRNLRSPFTTGVRHGGAGGGHMAGTLMGVNVESGGRGVQVGANAQGTGNFPHKFGFKPVAGDATAGSRDAGGWLMPGLNLLANETGRPEPVLTDAQWRDMHHLAESVGSDGTALIGDATFNLVNSEATVQQAFRRVDLELRKRRRGGVHSGRGR